MHQIWAADLVTTPASPRPPCHGTRRPASTRRWPSQALVDKGMARGGPRHGARSSAPRKLEPPVLPRPPPAPASPPAAKQRRKSRGFWLARRRRKERPIEVSLDEVERIVI